MRVGLVVTLVLLAAMVLLATGFAVTSALSRSLTARTDEQLYDAARSWAQPREMKQIVTNDGAARWIPADMPDASSEPRPFTEQPRRFFELRKGPTGQLYSDVPGTVAGTGTEASEEDARRSERRMRQFVADSSHELRTPLTTIRIRVH